MINVSGLSVDEFIEKYINDYEALRTLGYGDWQVRKMLATLQYVQNFICTPRWLECVDKLPKGTSWKGGCKYHQPAGKRNDAETYFFLSYENDLYLKGFLDRVTVMDGEKQFNRGAQICVIRNWKRYNAYDIYISLGHGTTLPSFMWSSILDFWHKNGGDVSLIEKKMLREIEWR